MPAGVRKGREARFRYGGVFVLALTMTILALLIPDGAGSRTLELVVSGATLLVAVATSGAPAATRRAVGGALGIAIFGAGAGVVLGAPPAALPLGLVALMAAATIAVISGGLLRLVMTRGVVLQAVFGALAIYLLVGLGFGFLIGALAAGFDGAYFAQGTDATQSRRVYFSFTVMSTTGFGDLTARTRPGRALAVLEMLVGQLYLVTVIAMLVGNLRRGRA